MNTEYKKYIEELPEIVQNAINNAQVTEKMRKLAKKYALHLDKWNVLEEEIIATLVGQKDPYSLPSNISSVTGLDITKSQEMTDEIVRTIFKPIREELQYELDTKQKAKDILTKKDEDTQPNEIPTDNYLQTNIPSSERKDVNSDPYRESID